ncbi:MAG TPA: MBL fold metallo-hydrolase [Hypericibacter adhaerens]|jgi:glyoxylase-like metal-dependent hydrolase (beta-lactamase superfamily II)|uniref:MBL fold metallo-hydrolase n=1 Tax=Hypericibacter adhaerens TaxID=2602016 RepID=A0A5J6MWD5_9PROT|nr:MBL fold metallo-hydrolase [Hypericibacter adhaerens]QEX21779.1 MBL fold metallo-hydrolase [Hypericibacter adhaerens]HWA42419.1 MBL fold metallo-hydrolase [Hypericibacter adhaerens]
MEIVTADRWYRVRAVGDGVTHIDEPHIKPFYRCNIWHVRGRERDLLIDSGLGVVSLRRHVAFLAERPQFAVASHVHFDHVGNHHEFAERAIHAAEAPLLAHPGRDETLATLYATEEMFTSLPPGGFDPPAYQVTPAPATRVLEDGDIVDLGDRHFEVFHLPGHSPGSIGLWEAASGILFAGDTVYDGPLIDDAYHSDIAAYIRSMERLRDLPVRVVHGGHFPSFGRERFVALIDAYLNEKRGA